MLQVWDKRLAAVLMHRLPLQSPKPCYWRCNQVFGPPSVVMQMSPCAPFLKRALSTLRALTCWLCRASRTENDPGNVPQPEPSWGAWWLVWFRGLSLSREGWTGCKATAAPLHPLSGGGSCCGLTAAFRTPCLSADLLSRMRCSLGCSLGKDPRSAQVSRSKEDGMAFKVLELLQVSAGWGTKSDNLAAGVKTL